MVALTESLAQHLSHADLTAIQAAIEDSDEVALELLVRPYLSTRKTSPMGSDLQNLRDLAQNEVLRKYITTIHIQDDWKAHDPGPMIAGPDAGPPPGAIHIWPRDEQRIVQSGAIGIADLRDMLISHRLRPETITIRDFRGGNVECDTQPCAVLARDLLDGVDMAVKSFAFRKDTNSYGALDMSFTLFPEYQGHGYGLSKLQSAQVILTRNVTTYWQDQLCTAVSGPFYHTIAHARPWPDADTPFASGVPAPRLSSLALVRMKISPSAVLDLIANSRTSLQTLTIYMVTLVGSNASWTPLLTQIARECSSLSAFNLSLLSVASLETPSTKFEISMESFAERDREGMRLSERGSKNRRTVGGVEYTGPNAASLLEIVARGAVNWKLVPGTSDAALS